MEIYLESVSNRGDFSLVWFRQGSLGGLSREVLSGSVLGTGNGQRISWICNSL